MQAADTQIVIGGGKRRPALALVFFNVSLGFAFGLITRGHAVGWMLVAVSVFALAASVRRLMPGAVWLRIDRTGVEWKYLSKRQRLSWQDVDSFYVSYQSVFPSMKLIVIRFSKSYYRERALAASSFPGHSSHIPDKFNESAERCCALLNAKKQVWGSPHARTAAQLMEDAEARARAAVESRLAQCNAVVAREPQNASRYVERSRVHEDMRRYDLAIEDISNALRLDPTKSYFYLFLRHRDYVGQGRLDLAREDIEAAVRLAPPGFEYYCEYLASVYHKLGQTTKAIDVLNASIRAHPNSAPAYARRAEFFERIGSLEEAVQDASEAIRLWQQDVFWRKAHALHYRAKLLVKLGRFQEALSDCNTCIEAEPKDWGHYRVRSEVYEAMGKKALARADYDLSCELNPSVNR